MITTVLNYLEDTAKRYPNKTAFSDTSTDITWIDLVTRSQKLSTVIEKYFNSGEPVPIMADKSVNTIVLFFASLYAGCFYSFFDATFPQERIASMLKTLNVKYILADEKFSKVLQNQNVTVLKIQSLETECTEYTGVRTSKIIDTDPVYANFTSGSTGNPKAVIVSHRSVIDFIACFTKTFNIQADENIANQAPFDFDVSVKDIFSAVFTGATVHLVPKMFFSFPTKLLDFLEERNITTLIWAVSALCIISSLDGFSYKIPSHIKKIMFSGEVMPLKHLSIWMKNIPNAQYVNLYGPTEITCNCTYYKIPSDINLDKIKSISIGIPFENERIYLLNEEDKLITEKETEGELCVSGTCLALGYYNNPEKTNSVFIQNPLNTVYFERIYRTGDLAKIGEDGLLYYVGRKDFQIKHMGHRIELNEIEGALLQKDGITRTCCIFEKNKITAFYTGTKQEKKDIILHLKSILPVFMIPSDFIYLDEFILNKNGKIDRQKLKELTNE